MKGKTKMSEYKYIKYSNALLMLIIKFMIGAFFLVLIMGQFKANPNVNYPNDPLYLYFDLIYNKIYFAVTFSFTMVPYLFCLFMIVTIGEIGIHVTKKLFSKLLEYTRMLNEIKNERKKLENES